MSTYQKKAERGRYPSDRSKKGRRPLKKCFLLSASICPQGGRPSATLMEVINDISYVVKTGCSWENKAAALMCRHARSNSYLTLKEALKHKYGKKQLKFGKKKHEIQIKILVLATL